MIHIYEIFDCVTGETQGYRNGLESARALCDAVSAHIVLDYLPAREEGYYICRGPYIKAGPLTTLREAEQVADGLSIVHHTLD